MSDARQSPIPQDRVNENIDQGRRANDSHQEAAEQERLLTPATSWRPTWRASPSMKDQGGDDRPGRNPKEQPGKNREEWCEDTSHEGVSLCNGPGSPVTQQRAIAANGFPRVNVSRQLSG